MCSYISSAFSCPPCSEPDVVGFSPNDVVASLSKNSQHRIPPWQTGGVVRTVRFSHRDGLWACRDGVCPPAYGVLIVMSGYYSPIPPGLGAGRYCNLSVSVVPFGPHECVIEHGYERRDTPSSVER